MSTHRDELSVRKDLLVAQSALYRAQLRYELAALRAGLSSGSSWAARGIKIFSIVRVVLSLVAFFRK